MPKAENDLTTFSPAPGRRRTLLAAAGAVIAGSGITAGVAATTLEVAQALNPDAEMIGVCAHHLTTHHDCNLHGGHLDPDECPLWQSYSAALDAVLETSPTTAEGWLAKARCAQAERDGVPGSAAEELAWSLLDDIQAGRVRLAGRA